MKMNRHELREQVFKLLFRIEFNTPEDMPEQIKLFIEDNVSKEKRDVIPVIADDNGVVWVFGFGVNKKNAKTKESKNILSVRVSEKNGFTKNE